MKVPFLIVFVFLSYFEVETSRLHTMWNLAVFLSPLFFGF